MSNFPTSLDDDTTLPFVNDNITEIGGEAINALRDAVFAIEQEIGIGASGSSLSIANRLDVSIEPNGTIKPSALTSLGLVTLPITDGQIADFAQIVESKLKLDHKTQDLYNYIKDLSNSINSSLGWISTTGIKLDPHLMGAVYRHTLDQIDVSSDTDLFLKNKFGLLRDNTNAYTLINDINNEFLFHQFADGSPVVGTKLIVTNDGSTYPSNYAHTAAAIWLNSSRFAVIPQTAQDLQALADFIDSSSIFLYGSRIQNLYSNGISKVSRSSSLLADGYGAPVVPETPAIAYLLNTGTNSSPFDDIDTGDDIIEFKPTTDVLDSNTFDEQFALVRVGDIIRINYGTVEVPFVIREKKYMQGGGNKKFIVRIAGKNLFYAPNATARIDRSLVNPNKYGVLAMAAANNPFSEMPSLIIGSPRGAQILSLGFNPAQFDNTHYNLYLALYPNGNPFDGYTILPAIDVTGNQGSTPGEYTLDSIISVTNNAFRQVGFNYRFISFSYKGEFGIMLADSYNNAGFSILNAVVDNAGSLDQTATQIEFPNNVVDSFAVDGYTPVDPLGFGAFGAAVASPPFRPSYGSPEAALQVTKLFLPLKRNNYYVNGIEKEKLNLQIDQILDGYGDGYWFATVLAKTNFPGSPPIGRVETTYRIPLDLSSSGLKAGKTLVVQGLGSGGLVDFGRFIIKSVDFNICNCDDNHTDITVYDSVHATGISPSTTLDVDSTVAIYFNSDSVSFNTETATDFVAVPRRFKRHFEVYINEGGDTFTHERGRINISGGNETVNTITLYGDSELNKLDIIKISPKLRGYQFGSVNKIALSIFSYNDATGDFDGYLASYDGTNFTHPGPLVSGKKGQVTRFYDETFNDYIDIIFDINTSMLTFTNRVIDFQLFPTLSLDDEVMLLATCQLNDISKSINQIRDERQFGNTSEKDLTTSAIDFISSGERLLHSNGVIRGFDFAVTPSNPNSSQLYLKGGVCLVNGKILQINNETITIPPIMEQVNSNLYDVNWMVCVNDRGEYQLIPILDPDVNITPTPFVPTRIFRAYNIVNNLTYNIEATTFSYIISSRKDLTPIYLVRSHVTAGSPPIFTLNTNDVRRYINDADTNLPLRLTTIESQGNFRSVDSILTWLRFNGKYNGIAFIKGATVSSGVVNDKITLNFQGSGITFDGEGNAVLTFTDLVTLGSRVTFKNMTINFNGGVTILDSATNLVFESCTINYNSNLTSPTDSNFAFNFNLCDTIRFSDCIISATYTQPVTNSAVFRVASTSKFSMDDCSINVTFVATSGITTPGDVFWFVNSSQPIISLTNIVGNFNKAIFNSLSSGMQIKDGIIASTYDPSLDFGWNGRDLVNSGSGYIYYNVTNVILESLIDNVSFIYLPAVASGNRFSFINIELSNINSALSDLQISNCSFSDVNLGSSSDGYRAAISIINTTPPLAQPNTTINFFGVLSPLLNNARISNNHTNKNQAIILTSKTVDDGYTFDGYSMGSSAFYSALAAINVRIENNICGTIGYWITSGTKIANLPPNVNAAIDQVDSLIIQGNTCHYISNLTSRGIHFVPSRAYLSGQDVVNTSPYPSGYVTISNNVANWIHVGIAFASESSLSIINNKLTAYDSFNYLDTGDTDISSPATRYMDGSYLYLLIAESFESGFFQATAIRVLSTLPSSDLINNVPSGGHNGSAVITGNIIDKGYFYNTTGTFVSYRYDHGIHCDTSCIVSQNIIKDLSPGSVSHTGILVGGADNIVTQNKIYRNTSNIGAYVRFESVHGGAWSTRDARGTIVDNFFDSPLLIDSVDTFATHHLVDIISDDEISTQWIIERNINQTGWLSLPMTNNQFATAGTGTISSATGLLNNFGTVDLPNLSILAPGGTGSYVYVQHKSNLLFYTSASTGTASYRFGWQENVSKLIPAGARLVEVKLGLKSFQPSVFDGYFDNTAYVVLTLNRYDGVGEGTSTDYTNLDSMTSIFSGDPHILNNVNINVATPPAPTGTETYDRITGSQITANGGTSTMYLDINTDNINGTGSDISKTFIAKLPTSQGTFEFGITVDAYLPHGTGSVSAHLVFSPIMIKYRW